jgi:hypothetical protein
MSNLTAPKSAVTKRSVVSKDIDLGDAVELERERLLLNKLGDEVR